ncbi:undecaprenyl-diphosphate phosphatase, partial [Patescibacteria group bacterium]|nr:undecaprenyl-diphosphate phosphatase [Patescibacteria group bacterium]
MNTVSGIILGAIQGLTEFLPVSSSGHLILARDILGLESSYGISGLSFDAVLQLATSLAILIYFRHEFLRLAHSAVSIIVRKASSHYDKMFLFALVLGTIPAVAVGLFIEDYMETVFRNAYVVGWTLLIGAGFMFAAEKVATQNKIIAPAKGLWIGFFQALALIPG